MEESEYDPERNETENEFSGGSCDVNFTVGGEEVSSDLQKWCSVPFLYFSHDKTVNEPFH